MRAERDFEVYKNDDQKLELCVVGFSWPAFLLGWAWALWHRLWLQSAGLLLVEVVALVSGSLAKLGLLPFSFGSATAVRLYAAYKAHEWRMISLEKRGFKFCGYVSAFTYFRARQLAIRGEIRSYKTTEAVTDWFLMQPGWLRGILAITKLTWKAAFRFKLFIVVALLLLAAVVGLPLLIKDDGTARGFTQILLTYTLSTITGLLGLSTLWLSCGTLARDIEESQMQMVVVKPIARWQIWLGKWLGIMSLNAALLVITGTALFALLQWRATKLSAEEQHILRNEVLVARASAKPPTYDKELEEMTGQLLQEALQRSPVSPGEIPLLRQQIREGLKADAQNVPPGWQQSWEIDLGFARNFLRDQPLYLRVKFATAEQSPSGTWDVLWQVGVPRETKFWRTEAPLSLAPDTFHELEVPPDLFDEQGKLTITVVNPNPVSLLFTMEEGLEVLYREGGFALNFARGIGIIFCWMAILAAVGLAAASFLSFPVAAFASVAVLIVVFSTGTMASAVEDGTILGYNSETGVRGYSVLDFIAIPTFKGILAVVNLSKGFSPIEALSVGRSITWLELGRAFVQMVMFLGGIFAAFGIWTFTRRELAVAQNNS